MRCRICTSGCGEAAGDRFLKASHWRLPPLPPITPPCFSDRCCSPCPCWRWRFVTATRDRRTKQRVSTLGIHLPNRAGDTFCRRRHCGRAAAVLDRADQVSGDPDSHPARQPRQLHSESRVGHQLFCRSLRSLILALPFILLRGSSTVGCVRCCWVSGWHFCWASEARRRLGEYLLGRAFEVITMERFSYWATLLALPFVGLAGQGTDRPFPHASRRGVGLAAAATCALAVAWSSFKPGGCFRP